MERRNRCDVVVKAAERFRAHAAHNKEKPPDEHDAPTEHATSADTISLPHPRSSSTALLPMRGIILSETDGFVIFQINKVIRKYRDGREERAVMLFSIIRAPAQKEDIEYYTWLYSIHGWEIATAGETTCQVAYVPYEPDAPYRMLRRSDVQLTELQLGHVPSLDKEDGSLLREAYEYYPWSPFIFPVIPEPY